MCHVVAPVEERYDKLKTHFVDPVSTITKNAENLLKRQIANRFISAGLLYLTSPAYGALLSLTDNLKVVGVSNSYVHFAPN